jgi:Phosphotransferase enzyme family
MDHVNPVGRITAHIIGTSPSEDMLSISARERIWAQRFGKPRSREFFFSRSKQEIHPNDHIRLLDEFDKVVPYICPSMDECVSVLRHPDLHLDNIFVDPTDLNITSIIDWQGTSALPFFAQAGYPRFLSNDGKGVSNLTELDKLPDHFDSLDADAKEELQYSHIRRLSCQLYIHTTGTHNRTHFQALRQKVNTVRAELMKRVGLPWDGDLVMFRGALLDVMENWERFSSDMCPLKYDTREIEVWRAEEKEWLEASESLETFRRELGINEEGWVRSEYYESFARNQELRLKITETADEDSRNEMWRVWPFKDDDDRSEWRERRQGE